MSFEREVGEHENDALDKEVDQTVEHNAASNVEETYETIVEELYESKVVEEPQNDTIEKDTNEVEHDETPEKDANEFARDTTLEKDTNEAEHDVASEKDANEVAHDAAPEKGANEAAVEKDWVEVEDVVEEDAYSNEVGGGNKTADDTKPKMVEEGESEMNEEEEDADSGFFVSDGDVGEDEVAQTDVSNRVVHNLAGVYGD
ncbi:hypothetical protein V6N12_062051 [Hibiscus sabdariffa]|uniref:Uncharacterized protein n=1 Tax=Hibiscus sabdariffa TaxID=183260 RepID=A0ABR2AQ49_9ROSI